jgi:hypothetical protein
MTTTRAIACTLALGGIAAPLYAQAGPTVDRRIDAVAVVPAAAAAGGIYDVHVVWSYSVGESGVPMDLSFGLDLSLNGTVVASQTIALTTGPPGSCTECSGFCGANELCLYELQGNQIVCACGSLRDLVTFPAVALVPGDEIWIWIKPAAGGVPESEPANDGWLRTFGGEPVYWNRRITALDVTPTLGGSYDISVLLAVEGNYEGLLRLPARLELRINGVPFMNVPVIDDWLVWSPCNAACDNGCVSDLKENTLGACGPDEDGPLPCGCQTVYVPSFPGVPASAKDLIEVIIMPPPGALPELPGFSADDSQAGTIPAPCPADVDLDGIVGITDLLSLLALWGTDPGGPPDLDGDHVVGIVDLLTLLAAWGPCP